MQCTAPHCDKKGVNIAQGLGTTLEGLSFLFPIFYNPMNQLKRQDAGQNQLKNVC